MSDELSVPAPISDKDAPHELEEPEQELRPETKFSWVQPHPVFVMILVGPEEVSFGIPKDFLCARSAFYRDHFRRNGAQDALEQVVKLPNTTSEVFGLTQRFLFTGQVTEDLEPIPSYEALIGVWKLGNELGIDGLCEKTLEAMVECRRVTGRIPATPLLVEVWRDTPEGSTIRKLLLSWTAEYMRSSDARTEFAKSLPHEVLSELVITMSSLENSAPQDAPADTVSAEPAPRKSVHYLEEDSDKEQGHMSKKNRRASAPLPGSQNNSKSLHRAPPPPVRKAAAVAAAATTPRSKPVVQKRRSIVPVTDGEITTEKKVEFCSDLLDRMLSGPGFWTRLVGPFKEPVNPVEDGVPDYFDKVKKPMDLNTIKDKMARREYQTENEFVADVRQIFENCYTYWTKGDPMWGACEKFQKTFEEKYAQMHKNITKMMREPVD
ncbi:Ankyrin repeat, bromo and BTB domain-containing protein [Colletotrichum chlorophyti]|uniref:Ankyrin repeat, bromo and BTB domain-containing protein n=1 Tax=Colletotrichum chlorophyti TaxID=708187 RepID=A0A1Q8S7E1_9PEZI|nr:Ankyrin repeat, bromo and BTB domain-containing protein [Colletotrichum chlorophyti]